VALCALDHAGLPTAGSLAPDASGLGHRSDHGLPGTHPLWWIPGTVLMEQQTTLLYPRTCQWRLPGLGFRPWSTNTAARFSSTICDGPRVVSTGMRRSRHGSELWDVLVTGEDRRSAFSSAVLSPLPPVAHVRGRLFAGYQSQGNQYLAVEQAWNRRLLCSQETRAVVIQYLSWENPGEKKQISEKHTSRS
jgi:hypothetical protein